MSILKPSLMADRVVDALKQGGLRGPELMEFLDRTDKAYTKQALYTALRQLVRDDVVVKHRGRYSLNTTWIIKLQTFAQRAARQYGVTGGNELTSLQEGESVSYTFQNSHTLDTFWGHAQNVLLDLTLPSEPVYALNPHYWFILAHQETERTLLEHIVTNKRQFLMAVMHKDPLDVQIAKEFDGTYTQYAYVTESGPSTDYTSTIGPYVLQVTLDPAIATKVDEVFAESKTVTQDVMTTLRALLSVRSKNKIKITRSARRAARIRARLKKYFYIKKPA